MAILQFGSSGPDVAKLQQRLTARGFPTGETNGTFGTGTDAAVRAYQRSDMVERRRSMMAHYATACRGDDAGGVVVPFMSGAA